MEMRRNGIELSMVFVISSMVRIVNKYQYVSFL